MDVMTDNMSESNAPDSRRGSINPILEMSTESGRRQLYRLPSAKLVRFRYLRRRYGCCSSTCSFSSCYSNTAVLWTVSLLVAAVVGLAVALVCVLARDAKDGHTTITSSSSSSSATSSSCNSISDATRHLSRDAQSAEQNCSTSSIGRTTGCMNTGEQSATAAAEAAAAAAGATSGSASEAAAAAGAQVCQLPGCIQLAAEMMTYGDRQADPCTDFFQFACGSFHSSRPRGQLPLHNVHSMLVDYNNARLEQLLMWPRQQQQQQQEEEEEEQQQQQEQKDQKKHLTDDLAQHNATSSTTSSTTNHGTSAVVKAQHFYIACLRAKSSGLRLADNIMALVRKYGGWPNSDSWSPSTWNFDTVHANILKYHQAEMFFDITRYNSTHVHVNKAQVPDYLHSGRHSVVLNTSREMYKNVLRQIAFQIAHELKQTDESGSGSEKMCDGECVEAFVNDTLTVYEKIGKMFEPRPPLIFLNPVAYTSEKEVTMSLTQLQSLSRHFNWTNVFRALYGATVDLDSMRIVIPSRKMVHHMEALVSTHPASRLQRFMLSRLFMRYIDALGYSFGPYAGKSASASYTFCLELLQTHLPRAVQGLFIHNHIGSERLASFEQFFEQVTATLADNLDWMGEKSRNYVLRQVGQLKLQLGALDRVVNESSLDHYYSRLEISNVDAMKNLINIDRFTAELKAEGTVDSPKLYHIKYPHNLDIFLDRDSNRLVLPYGSLQVPLYHEHVPAALNAATIGGLVYRQLARAFVPLAETIERHHTAIPSNPQLWDNKSIEAVEHFYSCLENVTVTSFAADSSNYNRGVSIQDRWNEMSKTLQQQYGFVMAKRLFDRLSASVSTDAKGASTSTPPPLLLPGSTPLTPAQLFFTLYVQSDCEVERPAMFMFGSHSLMLENNTIAMPAILRRQVNKMVHGDAEFRRAFNCKTMKTPARTCPLFE